MSRGIERCLALVSCQMCADIKQVVLYPNQEIMFRWRGHASLLFSNWLNYYLYQATPYNLDDLRDGKEDAWKEAFQDEDSLLDDKD